MTETEIFANDIFKIFLDGDKSKVKTNVSTNKVEIKVAGNRNDSLLINITRGKVSATYIDKEGDKHDSPSCSKQMEGMLKINEEVIKDLSSKTKKRDFAFPLAIVAGSALRWVASTAATAIACWVIEDQIEAAVAGPPDKYIVENSPIQQTVTKKLEDSANNIAGVDIMDADDTRKVTENIADTAMLGKASNPPNYGGYGLRGYRYTPPPTDATSTPQNTPQNTPINDKPFTWCTLLVFCLVAYVGYRILDFLGVFKLMFKSVYSAVKKAGELIYAPFGWIVGTIRDVLNSEKAKVVKEAAKKSFANAYCLQMLKNEFISNFSEMANKRTSQMFI